MRGGLGLLVVAGSALVASCETPFDPFEDSGEAFSLFGYLDAAADTQFVRVAALRPSVAEGASLEATVTLEDLAGGATTTLRDSVVTFGNGASAHNFWTDAPVLHAARYRLTTTGPDGATSVVVETPPPFPAPVLDAGVSPISTPANPPTIQAMRFEGIEKLADLRITYRATDPDAAVTVSYLDRVRRSDSGGWVVAFNAYDDVQRALSGAGGVGCPGLRSARVFVAAANADWPDFSGLDIETLVRPGAVSNVEGGLGYVGGVSTWRADWSDMPTVFRLYQAGCRS